MSTQQIQLMAHLMRRAGFGASKDELKALVEQGYEATVERLLDSDNPNHMSLDLIRRYHPDHMGMMGIGAGANWMYRMISTDAPLREKATLFWHGIFATGYSKLANGKVLHDQIRMFSRHGMGSFRTLLLELSKDPAMIVWLDNCENHNGAINENYGRELLELFSLGVGNYSEKDIKEASRAFTGWTIGNTEYMTLKSARDSIWPYGRLSFHFEFKPEDHDDGEKEFLGRKGRFNGDDIIDIICEQPATARFISRHMYSFFVADEPPVPEWPYKPPRDPEAIEELSQAYFDSGYNIREMLRVLSQVRLLQVRGRVVRAGEESGRVVGRRAEADRGVRPPAGGDDPDTHAVLVHGAAPAQPAVGRGMALGHGMDRLGGAGGARQLRIGATGEPRKPRGRCDGQQRTFRRQRQPGTGRAGRKDAGPVVHDRDHRRDTLIVNRFRRTKRSTGKLSRPDTPREGGSRTETGGGGAGVPTGMIRC